MIYQKLKRTWTYSYANYIPDFNNKFPELKKISREEMCDRFQSLDIDFYTQQNTPRKEVSLLKKGDRVLVYENDLQNITQPYKILHQETHFKITKLSLKFLNPKTRNEKLKKLYLLEILN